LYNYFQVDIAKVKMTVTEYIANILPNIQ